MDPLALAQIITLAMQGITQLTTLAAQAAAAHAAGDQLALDAIRDKIVAQSNALAPPGGIAPVPVIG